MALIAELETKLTANTTNLEQGINKSMDSMKSFAKGIVALGIGAIISHELLSGFESLQHVISETSEKIEKLANVSSRLGVGVPELQKLHYAAQQAGISTEAMDKSLGFLEKSLAKAANGDKQVNATLETMGLSAKDFVGLKIDQAYVKIAEASQKMTDANQKTLAVMTLMGRGGAQQLQLLNRDVQSLINKFGEFGGVLSTKQAVQVREYTESVKDLSHVWDAFALQLTAAVAGPFTKFLEALIKSITAMGGLKSLAQTIASVMVSVMSGFTTFFLNLAQLVEKTIIKVEQLLKLLLQVAQYGTLGAANVIAGTGAKIATLNADIKSRQGTVSTLEAAQASVNSAASGVSAPSSNNNQTITVKISAEDGLKASVAESPQIKAKINAIMDNIMSSSATGAGR